MSSPLTYPAVLDDKDLDDSALWAMIDSAAATSTASASASASASKCNSHVSTKFPTRQPPSLFRKILPDSSDNGEVVQDPWPYRPPRKLPRMCPSEKSSSLALVRTVPRTPPAKILASPEAQELTCCTEVSPLCLGRNEEKEKENGERHSLLGMFPSVSLFKEYQNAAMAILEKTDYTLISGSPFIKKSGTRILILMSIAMFSVLSL